MSSLGATLVVGLTGLKRWINQKEDKEDTMR